MPDSVLLPPAHHRPDGLTPGGWWSRKGDRILCELCPRACLLKEGDRGFCFVRQNLGDEIVLTTYGRSTGFCIDPIEKKPLNHFLPGTAVLSFGTAGCNLGCKFCQNWSISKSREVEKLSDQATPEAIAEAAVATGCRSVAFTYNDPIIWAEYAMDAAAACHARDIKTVAVTAAYITPQARGPFFEVFDAANVDLKAFSEEFYRHVTLSHLQPILDTLRWLKRETDVWFEITNLLIPDENDSPDELRRLCDWILENVGPDVPIHFTAFHPDFRMQDKPRTPHETLIAAREQALQTGLRFAYVGNVNDRERQSTFCPGCDQLLIERDWHQLGTWRLDGNCCSSCGTTIPGLFEDQPGNWGRRRQPVDMNRFTADVQPAGGQNRLHQIDAVFATSGPLPMSSSQPEPSATNRDAPGGLDEHQRQVILDAAAQTVRATVEKHPIEWDDPDLAGTAAWTLSGVFVSLKRSGHLRSCCGLQGQPVRLDQALQHAAKRTATQDPRFPPVSPSEFDFLDLEVWLLYRPEEVSVQGDSRIAEVTIGRHGLQVIRGDSRGLLLPGVATDNHWDAQTFLDQVCIKANLPPTAWRDPGTQLFTFEGDCLKGRLADSESVSRHVLNADQVAASATFCNDNIRAQLTGGISTPYFSGAPDVEVQGIVLQTNWLGNARPSVQGRLAFRSSLPLQATLFELVEAMATRLRRTIQPRQLPGLQTDLLVLCDTALHGTAGAVDLGGADRGDRAILVRTVDRFAVCWDRRAGPQELLDRAASEVELTHPHQAPVFSMLGIGTADAFTMKMMPQPIAVRGARPPAVAGRFYAEEADELERQVEECFSSVDPSVSAAWPAAMVPHAGLQFSGRIAARTLARIDLPETIIVIGPKHTRHGVPWAVAPQDSWNLPGGEVAGNVELAGQLAQAIPGLELDEAAHREEHAIEVELPLIRRLAPESQVVGITIGQGDFDSCRHIAGHLATVIDGLDDPPLLLISSDMNHFASDEENRRLDQIALEAMESRDPEKLLRTVRDNHISMCGVLPAVIVMETLKQRGGLTRTERTGYATSADTTADTSRVVGYAGMLLE